ncbi:hypothetical protein BDBG_16200 [Blastomyces gilchristii SLH14081]|uniref:Beta-lactamase-like ARB-00930-like C-terminal domain-containing protein n=1 Tax=Blastomyces gilchristii (strain SLH14081) TaxID=559298 RepID=A0A179UA87_BLAGS|nr:uncharacterized protein BDBG_16200 [Blastomyces gilchristii SLH14081]OAT04209.1 hypothetical protein BDBG_16200 [Blastomyces gilchristii SLH14081]
MYRTFVAWVFKEDLMVFARSRGPSRKENSHLSPHLSLRRMFLLLQLCKKLDVHSHRKPGQNGKESRPQMDKAKQDDGITIMMESSASYGYGTVPQDNKRMSDLPAQGALVDTCDSWQLADLLTYGGQGVDKVVFILEEESRDVVGVQIPFLRSGRFSKGCKGR